jgi:hypothetical protein
MPVPPNLRTRVLSIGSTNTNTAASSSSGTSPAVPLPPLVWTPGDSLAFANQTNALWSALSATLLECTGAGSSGSSTQGSITSEQQAQFLANYEDWSSFYNSNITSVWPGLSFSWNAASLTSYQTTALAWYSTMQSACTNANLPVLEGPADSWSAPLETVAATLSTVATWAAVGLGIYLVWPILVAGRGVESRAVRRNPRRSRARRRR